MDYLDHRFVLVMKDPEWNDEQIRLFSQPLDLSIGSSNGVVFFVLESLPIDSADFYFLPEESDSSEEFEADRKAGKNAEFDLYILNGNNEIVKKKSTTLNQKDSEVLWQMFDEQRKGKAYQDEVDLLMEFFEPYELAENKAKIKTRI